MEMGENFPVKGVERGNPSYLCLIPADGIFYFVWGIAVEMVCLALGFCISHFLFWKTCFQISDWNESEKKKGIVTCLHWPKSTLHPAKPLHYFPIPISITFI